MKSVETKARPKRDIPKAMYTYRTSSRKTQLEMANALGISQQQYSLLERGGQEPSLEFIQTYQEVTGVDLLNMPGDTQSHSSTPASLDLLLVEKERLINTLMRENELLRSIISKNTGTSGK